MMKKRVLTTLLALSVMFTSIPVDGLVYAQEVTSISTQETEGVQTENFRNTTGVENSDSVDLPENIEDAEIAENRENAEETESTEIPGNIEGTESTETLGSAEGTESTETLGSAEGTESTETLGSVEETESAETLGSVEETESTETTGDNDEITGAGSDGTVNVQESTESANALESTEIPEDNTVLENAEKEEAPAKLNYVMVESDYLATPVTQNVVASIGTAEMKLKDIQMVYQNLSTGEVFTAGTTAEIDDMVLFSLQYESESQSGIYQVIGFKYICENKEYELNLKELEMDVRYGVNKDANAAPDQLLQDADSIEQEQAQVDASVVTMDEKGKIISETTVEDVLASGTSELSLEEHIKGVNGNLVVVLDPGHDATHTGAHQNGAAEEELVFKIASYCKAELDTYSGVTVYMTRNSLVCPNGGSTVTSGTCNEKRVAYAAAVGAHIYVSFHLNSSTSTSAHGVGVYYPNSNYNAQIGAVGQGVATQILSKLTALGLSQWTSGIIIWNAQMDKYPDGSAADYLGVIRNCKKVGIPAVLIEHAFISNYSDYVNYLNSDEKLKQLGVADAQAIADAYGLKKGADKAEIQYTESKKSGQLKIKWKMMGEDSSYELYRSTMPDSGYEKIATIEDEGSYMDQSAEIGTKYYYMVRAVYSNNTVSELSDPVAGQILEGVELSYVKGSSSKRLELGWKAVAGAEGYYIYRRNPDEDSFEKIAKIESGSTLIYTDKISSNNKKYTYRIQAYNVCKGKEGVGAYSGKLSGKSVAKPTITAVKASGDNALKIKWKKVSGATGFEIMRSTQKDSGYKQIASISSGDTLSYKDKKVDPGQIYYYKVQAVNESNGEKGVSGYSGVASGKTVAKTKITSVNSKKEDVLEIKWKKVSDASGYRIKRSTDKNGSYEVIKTIKSNNTTSYQDKKVEVGKTYYYKIETMVKNGETTSYSGESDAVKGKTVAKTKINYVVSAGSDTMKINWNSVKGAWGYRIKRSTSKNGEYTTVKTLKGKDKTTYTDKSVETEKKYYYKVETINMVNDEKGYSGDSKVSSGKTLAKVKITDIKAEHSKKIRIKWKKVLDASGYWIYRSTSKNGDYKKVGTVYGDNTTVYKDKSVEAGKTYYYKIRAYKDNSKKTGVGSYSSTQKAWTLKKVVITKVSGTSGNQVTLNWEKVKNASGYQIYRSTKENSGFDMIKEITSGDTVKYKDTKVKEGKKYYYQIVAITKIKGDSLGRSDYSEKIKVPVLGQTKMTGASLEADNSILIKWDAVKNATGYELSVSDKRDGEYKTLMSTDKTACNHTQLTSNKTYYYKVRAYAQLSSGKKVYSAWSSVQNATTRYEIMGESSITVNQMVNYYNTQNYTYPSDVYKEKGAANITEFVTILKEEAEMEGVKAEVLFAQVMLETGGLKFGGDVDVSQCNFGGIGATGNGVAGETFADVRTGLRVQTQHLKAYASTQPLKNACVDVRFKYVTRGSAPYIEWLSIPNNPYGKGWAADAAYAVKLLTIINTVKKL